MKENYALLLYMIVLLTLGVAQAAEFEQSNDFDNPGDPYYVRNTPTAAHNTIGDPFIAGPDASSDGQFLRLFQYTPRHLVNVGFDAATTDDVTDATVEFDFRVTCAGTRTGFGCGDGFQMSLLPTADLGETGTIEAVLTERQVLQLIGSGGIIDPSNGAVIFTFNTFPNGGGETYNNLEIQTRGQAGPIKFPLDQNVFDIATGLNQTPGAFQHARLEIHLTTPRSVTVELTDATGVSITPIDFALTDGAQPYAMRLAFGARNGDAAAAIDLDNIIAKFTTATIPDEDGDGVNDEDDLCPGSETVDVDEVGCSDAQVDGDGDGVCDAGAASGGPSECEGEDFCPDTSIPEGVPTQMLLVNRWALTDDDGTFNTVVRGRGPGPRPDGYSIEDTAGCSCAQILAAQGLENDAGNSMFGCSISVMDDWVELVSP